MTHVDVEVSYVRRAHNADENVIAYRTWEAAINELRPFNLSMTDDDMRAALRNGERLHTPFVTYTML